MLSKEKIKFILASGSPRRKELIGHLQIPYVIMTADIEESSEEQDPELFALEVSSQKGRAVLNMIKENTPLFLVSADTVVALNNKIYGKPRDESEAREFLLELSDQEHSVFTAVTMFLKKTSGEIVTREFVEETLVNFGVITPELLERYLKTNDSLDKAGAYGIQGPSLTFINSLKGDYANVVGFPLSRFINEAQAFFDEQFQKKDMWLNYF